MDYSDIGLDNNLNKKDSLAVRSDFTTASDFNANYETAAISAPKIDRNNIFTLGTAAVEINATIASGYHLELQVVYTPNNVLELIPFPAMADLYIGTVDDTHLRNSYGLKDDLTSDQLKTDFRMFFGQREYELYPRQLGMTYYIANPGTQSYDYFLNHKLVYSPIAQ